MAQLTVPTETFTGEGLPAVCAVSGVLAEGRYVVRANTSMPRWTLGLLLLGVLPYFVAAILMRRSCVGHVYLARAVVQAMAKARFVALGLFGTGALVAMVGSSSGSGPTSIAGVALLLSAVAFVIFTAQTTVGARISGDGSEVTLLRVHPDFVRAASSTPAKCAGCTSHDSCSVAEMAECAGVEASIASSADS